MKAVAVLILCQLLLITAITPAQSTAQVMSTFPAIASDGENYFVVWQDDRSGSSWDIFGARVTASGAVIDPHGIAIAASPDDELRPSVAFDGTNYLVVWERGDRLLCCSDIFGARVSTSGTVLDPNGIQISHALEHQWLPDVAFDGAYYVVVWQDRRNHVNWDIYGTHVNTDGIVLNRYGSPIAQGPDSQELPAVACDSLGRCLSVWKSSGGSVPPSISVARVDKTLFESTGADLPGERIELATTAMASEALSSDIAFGDSCFLAVWQDYGFPAFDLDVFGLRVDLNGKALDPGVIPISAVAYDQRSPSVAFDGTDYFVVWQDLGTGTSIFGARVTGLGDVLEENGIPISVVFNVQEFPAVTFGETDYLVAWTDYRKGTDSDIYMARVSQSGTVLDPEGLTDVLFASASAVIENACAKLSWEMGVDVPALSFSVLRSERVDGEYLTLNLPVFRSAGLSYYCTDCSVTPGKSFWYKIVLSSPLGDEVYGPIEVRVPSVPVVHALHQSYPNPFNPSCMIYYDTPIAGRVRLSVFDLAGRLARTLVDAHREPGSYSELWDGRAEDGSELPSGVYFYRLEAGEFVATRKMVLLK